MKKKRTKNVNLTPILTRADWTNQMLHMEEALVETIHHIITYHTLRGPWNDKDANDGWRVLEGIIAKNKAALYIEE
jgi:hypothetical protein